MNNKILIDDNLKKHIDELIANGYTDIANTICKSKVDNQLNQIISLFFRLVEDVRNNKEYTSIPYEYCITQFRGYIQRITHLACYRKITNSKFSFHKIYELRLFNDYEIETDKILELHKTALFTNTQKTISFKVRFNERGFTIEKYLYNIENTTNYIDNSYKYLSKDNLIYSKNFNTKENKIEEKNIE